jgi:DNA end-binding protein Ku
MAARSLASLTISFGLVSVPVKIYTTVQSGTGVPFHYIHKDCGSRLRQQYFCIKEDVPVERSDMVKGFEFSKDRYVTFEPGELKELEEKGSGAVEITEFVPADRIDPIYYEKAYYVAPDKRGEKPYALLAESMRKTGRCALARWAARGKQYLVQLRAVEDGIIMQQLRYADEVKPMSEVDIEKGEVKAAELDLAMKLIDQISADEFDPGKYQDDVKERIEAAIEKKVEGKEISVSPSVPEHGEGAQVIDLMEALRGSLGKAARPKEANAAGAAKSERKPPRRAAATTPSGGSEKRARGGRK